MSEDLIGRAADVMLKERRKLVLVARDTPLSLIHLENMAAVTRAGAMVLPAMPSFYGRPQTIEELLDTVVGRVLDHLGVPIKLGPRWGEEESVDERMTHALAEIARAGAVAASRRRPASSTRSCSGPRSRSRTTSTSGSRSTSRRRGGWPTAAASASCCAGRR